MKKLLFLVAVVAVSAVYGIDDAKKALIAEKKEKLMRQTGGFVVSPVQGRGIKFIKIGDNIPTGIVESVSATVRAKLRFATLVVDGKAGEKYMPDATAGAVVIVKDDASCPLTVVTAHEQGWASLNIAPLRADNPSDEKLRRRIMQEMCRTVIYMLGGGNNRMPSCVMKAVVNLKDLDDIKGNWVCPEPFVYISESARKLGIEQAKMVTYRKACIEGWAPAPKNEYQKAIWETVKAEQNEKPSNPIVIKPGQKPEK